MADRECIAVVGQNRSGKTTLLGRLTAGRKRVFYWDWKDEGEFAGPAITLDEVPALFRRRAWHVRYVPPTWGTYKHFDGLAHVLLHLGQDFTLVVDEVTTAVHKYEEGGLCQLLRYAGSHNVSVIWSTQKPTGIPSALKGEVYEWYVFHLHDLEDLKALRGVLSEEERATVARLPRYQYIHKILVR